MQKAAAVALKMLCPRHAEKMSCNLCFSVYKRGSEFALKTHKPPLVSLVVSVPTADVEQR